MTPEFTAAMTTRLTALTADLAYYHKPSQGKQRPQIIKTQLPPKDDDYLDGQDFPLVCWSIPKGEWSLKPQPFEVIITCGLMVNEHEGTPLEQLARGSEQIEELLVALAQIATARKTGGYKLQLPLAFNFGDTQPGHEGIQPFPFFWARLHLSFLAS